MRNKIIMLILSATLIAGLVLTSCAPKAAPPEEEVTPPAEEVFLAIGTGSPGGCYYPLGGGIAVIIEKMTDYRAAAESTAASVENIRLIDAGKLDMGWSEGGIAMAAVNGEEPFEHPIAIKALFNAYSSVMHLITIEGSGIESIYDLKGKRVGSGQPKQATDVSAAAFCEAVGYKYPDDFAKVARLTTPERVRALIDGIIDFTWIEGAFPYGSVMEIAAARHMVLLPMTDEEIEAEIKVRGWGVKYVIPAGTYQGIDYDVPCFGTPNVMLVPESMPEDLAYELTKVIFENADTGKYALTDIHPIAAQMCPETGANAGIPLHPGAERYYREVGAIK